MISFIQTFYHLSLADSNVQRLASGVQTQKFGGGPRQNWSPPDVAQILGRSPQLRNYRVWHLAGVTHRSICEVVCLAGGLLIYFFYFHMPKGSREHLEEKND